MKVQETLRQECNHPGHLIQEFQLYYGVHVEEETVISVFWTSGFGHWVVLTVHCRFSGHLLFKHQSQTTHQLIVVSGLKSNKINTRSSNVLIYVNSEAIWIYKVKFALCTTVCLTKRCPPQKKKCWQIWCCIEFILNSVPSLTNLIATDYQQKKNEII